MTPEGYIWTGFGELMFFTGLPPVPVHERIRTLHKGHLPAIKFNFVQDSIRYSFPAVCGRCGRHIEGRAGELRNGDNLRTLHPEILFDPADPRVEATLRTVRSRYLEGCSLTLGPCIGKQGDEFLFDEQPGLHYWQTPTTRWSPWCAAPPGTRSGR